jgi:hypothetical protein
MQQQSVEVQLPMFVIAVNLASTIYSKRVAPQIEFSFRLTEEDVAHASDAFSVRWWRLLLPGVATSLVGVLGAIALIVLQPDWLGVEFPQWLGIDFAVIAAGLVLAGWAKVIPKLRRWLAVRHFRRTPTAHMN